MRDLDAAVAARDNAHWCDAVCAAHGRPGELSPQHWLQRAPSPPHYPNLVTLQAEVEPALRAVEALDAHLRGAWSVKDSFGSLPLERHGFRPLFEAEWIARPARRERAGACWLRVASEAGLAAWESAWSDTAGEPRTFPASLLARPDVAFLATRGLDGAVAAGVVASRSARAVGVSNFFAREGEREAQRAAALAAASAAFPDLPLVGYEHGGDLAACRALGFASLGRLRVWTR